jgi:predicted NBD/HSP70 family sugar kinase
VGAFAPTSILKGFPFEGCWFYFSIEDERGIMKFLLEPSETKVTSQQTIKEENIKSLFNLVKNNEQISRAGLVRKTKLSPTTVSILVDELLQANLLIETGLGSSDMPGRKPINLRVCADGRQIPVFSLSRWGVHYTLYDLELNEIETCFVEHLSDQYGGFHSSSESDPDSGNDYCELIYDIFMNKAKNIDSRKVAAVCITFPGIYLEAEQMLSYSAMHVSIKSDAIKLLESKLSLPVFFGNSSMCMAYAEKNTLSRMGREVRDLLYINVTDGVGAGIVYNNQVIMGSDHSAGEIGHVSIDYNGKPCPCGNHGCLEQYINTDAIKSAARKILAEQHCSAAAGALQGRANSVTLENIAEAYDNGVEAIRDLLKNTAKMLYAGINSAVCITGIKQVVLGGDIERLGTGFFNELQQQSKENGNSFLMKDVLISYAMSGSKGDSIGVAEYFMENQLTSFL